MALHVLFWPVMMYGMADADLGRRIRRAREAKRLHGKEWTQEYLASLLGVSVRSVGRWEREGTVPRGSIGALEQVLGVSLADDSDPKEERLRAALAELREDSLIEADDVTYLMERYERRRRRGNGGTPGVAERAG